MAPKKKKPSKQILPNVIRQKSEEPDLQEQLHHLDREVQLNANQEDEELLSDDEQYLNEPAQQTEFDFSEQNFSDEEIPFPETSTQKGFSKGVKQYPVQQQQQAKGNVPSTLQKLQQFGEVQDYYKPDGGTPESERDLALGQSQSHLQVSSKDLLRTKKKLKPVKQIKQNVTMHRDVLFDIYKVSTHYPLEKIKGLFVINEFIVNKLDFTGVQQLTDLFFKAVLLVHSNSLFLNSVEHISLQGCQHITDVGVSWMCDVFNNLKSVSLNCCHAVTERALHVLMTKCPEIQTISAKATSVGLVPVAENDLLCGFKLLGSPVLSPSYSVINNTDTLMSRHTYLKSLKEQPVFSTYKAVVLKNVDLSVDLLQTLATGNMVEQSYDKAAFTARQVILSDDCTLNMAQCSVAFLDMISAERTLYILPFDADDSNCSQMLLKLILHLKYKFPSAVFVLVGVSQKSSFSLKSFSHHLEQQLGAYLKTVDDTMLQLTQDIFINQKDLFFPEQIRAGYLLSLRDCLPEEGDGLVKFDVFLVDETVCQTEKKGVSLLRETLRKAARRLGELHAIYSYLSEDLIAMVSNVPKQPRLVSEVNFIRQLREKHRNVFGPKASVYRKALDLMHMLGSIIYVKNQSDDDSCVVTDFDWFSEMINQLINCRQTAADISDDILSVHPSTKVMAIDNVKDILKSSMDSKQISRFKNMLREAGLLFEEEHARVLIMSSDLLPEPPMPVGHYIDERPEVNSVKVTLVIPTGLVHSLWPAVLISVSHIHSTAMIWNSGVVIQDSPVVIYIRITDVDEHSEIQLTAQSASGCVFPQCQEEETLRKLWNKNISLILGNTLKQYQIPIEHCLHKWHIFYLLTELTGTNFVPPESKDVWSFLVVNHQPISDPVTKDIICKHCGMKTSILEKLWCQYKEMSPSFITEHSFSTENLQASGNKGSLFITRVQKGVICPMNVMCSTGFNELSVTFLSDSGFGMTFVSTINTYDGRNIENSLGTGSLAEKQLFSVNVKEGKIEVVTRKQKSKAEPSVKDREPENGFGDNSPPASKEWITESKILDDIFTVGDCLIAKLQHSSNKEDIQYSIELIGGDVLHKEVLPSYEKWIPVIQTDGQISLCIDSFKAPDILSLNNEWQVGMKLEAVDKQNPHLICVATVDELGADDSVLIHFDGWTARYDYWTSKTDPDLHPMGYMDYMIANRALPANVNGILQQPYNYLGTFTWKQYLKETKSSPVPHHLFTEEQTGGAPPLVLDEEFEVNERNLSKSCFRENKRPSYIQRALLVNTDRSHGAMKARRDYPYVLLPKGLDATFLKYPSLKNMWLSNSEELRLICNLATLYSANSSGHIIEHDSLEISNDKKKSYADVLVYQRIKQVTSDYLIMLTEQKNFIMGEMKQTVKGVENWNQTQIEEKLVQLFLVFLPISGGFFQIIGNNNELMSSLKNMKQYTTDVMKILEQNKTLNQHLVAEGFPQCHLHRQATSLLAGKDLTSMPIDVFANNYHFITELNLENNHIRNVPQDFFTSFVKLSQLNLTNNDIDELPRGAPSCTHLEVLLIGRNKLKLLPSDIGKLADVMTIVDISQNPFHNLPSCLFELVKLVELHANDIILSHLPPDIGNLKKLTILELGGNALRELPDEIMELTSLEELDLSGVSYQAPCTPQGMLSLMAVRDWVSQIPILSQNIKEVERLFQHYNITGSDTLDHHEVQKFIADLYKMFPRLEQKQADVPELLEKFGCCPPQLFSNSDEESKFPHLRVLNLSFQGLRKVCSQFKQLKSLENLGLAHNPCLESISGEISTLRNLNSMSLRDCPVLKTPPREIVARGFKATFGYLRRINLGSVECKRTKLMMVGLGGAGKTSLVRAFRSHHATSENEEDEFDYYLTKRYGTTTEGITDGIDITDWKVDEITFSMWDFAGQTVYYNTHQFFMSNRAIYLLLWNIRLGYEHAGLEFWLSSIACHAPKAPVLVVGTHRDQVEKYWLPKEDLMAKYPQIKSLHEISCVNRSGITSLVNEIVSVALREKYMGERIPEAWLKFEENMLQKKKQHDSLTWNQVESCAEECGIIDKHEIGEAVQFLHELGSVQHFQNHFLKHRVVINPQWIVDAMACVVSVHNTPIKDGKLLHSDINKVWANFDKDLYVWLLRLTEEFDLTFPLKDEKANIVPCLLPAKQPEFGWPDVSTQLGSKEIKILYKFDYLPAGLFNRVQVRLYQFSDSSLIWKNGSLLKKNMHTALMKQEKNNVFIKVQGPRPENIKFMIHEVFEALIAESFHGVTYDYFVPCSDCVKALSHDPSLFPASKIRRATELKVPFLQCDKLFHTLSLHELHAVMPPDSSVDFDIHLEHSLRDLDNLRDDLSYDIAIVYNNGDIPDVGEDLKKIHPRKIKIDLENNGYTVWFPADPSQIDLRKETIMLREAKLVIICISNNFVSDPHSAQLFYYITKNLQKQYQLVALGPNYDWKKSDIGMMVTTAVYVNMMSPERYSHKIKELLDAVREHVYRLEKNNINTGKPQCFISYCWGNSADAVQKGTKSTKEAIGFGDPRAFKAYLEENGIRCWIDVDNVGKGSLFEEIAEGLKHAKVMVVCVSDEYVNSQNCLVEFRFATVTLKIPLVIAVVGTGYAWETTEVGMLSLGYPKVNLQHETLDGMQRLLSAVRKYIPESGDEEETLKTDSLSTPSYTPSNNNQLAFLELLELAQRKFLRQLSIYADSMDTSPYPRLLAMDFFKPKEKERYLEEQKQRLKGEERKANSQDVKCSTSSPRKTTDDELPGSRSEESSEYASLSVYPASSASQRPGSATGRKRVRLLKRKSTVNLDVSPETLQDPDTDFCIRFLCEHEEGWHDTEEILPMFPIATDSLTMDDFFNDIAPYMARLYAILKHTSLDLPVLTTDRGDNLRNSLIRKCGLESEFQKEYVNWRKSVMDNDPEGRMGGLARCHLPNGKVLWLCPEHQNGDRVTILSEDALVISMKDAIYDDSIALATTRPDNTVVDKGSQEQSQSPEGQKLEATGQRSKISGRSSSDSGHSIKDPEVQKAVAQIISKGVTRQGSKACLLM